MLIELKDVAKRYGEGPLAVTALTGIELFIDQGEFVVVLGPSGSGKTTLLNVVGALDTASEGLVRVDGVDITAATRRDLFDFRAGTVSFIFQAFNLFPGLTVRENVQFGVESWR
jgi:putative ABC transport system ATP-binding protein